LARARGLPNGGDPDLSAQVLKPGILLLLHPSASDASGSTRHTSTPTSAFIEATHAAAVGHRLPYQRIRPSILSKLHLLKLKLRPGLIIGTLTLASLRMLIIWFSLDFDYHMLNSYLPCSKKPAYAKSYSTRWEWLLCSFSMVACLDVVLLSSVVVRRLE
jgi:hypothetical protein